ncbi:MAG: hypothetical protein IBJ12_15385 [Sphingomonadaceae bacterium]|nr:hypothetical protein [Sphingomonadaceae bacterium]
MQTERVTYLTSAEQKAALEAFAKARGESVGNVLREATSRYMAQPRDESEEEAELAALVEQVNAAIPKMNATIDDMQKTLRSTHLEVDRMLREMGARK